MRLTTRFKDRHEAGEILARKLQAYADWLEYVISRTRLTSPAYDGAVAPLLAGFGKGGAQYWGEKGRDGIIVLRATVMNPFSASRHPDHLGGLAEAVRKAAGLALGNLNERRELGERTLASV